MKSIIEIATPTRYRRQEKNLEKKEEEEFENGNKEEVRELIENKTLNRITIEGGTQQYKNESTERGIEPNLERKIMKRPKEGPNMNPTERGTEPNR